MSAASIIREVRGRGVAIRGSDIDTDRIIPARFLRCVSFEKLGESAFEDDRKALAGRHPFDLPRHRGASVLVGGRNFGCGSSREHAPQALMRWGIKAIVAESFAEIFRGNCTTLGIPCCGADPASIDTLQAWAEEHPQGELTVDLDAQEVRAGNQRFAVHQEPSIRKQFLTGEWDALGLLLADYDVVRRFGDQLPAIKGY